MDKRYRPWYEKHPGRFEEERAQMLARGFILNEEALAMRKAVEFSGQSTVDSSRPLIVRYPDAFPSFPPRVFSDGNILARHHQPDSKEVCLFGPGQPRWSAELPGTAAIDEAEVVIGQFGDGVKPAEHDEVPEPSTAVYHYDPKMSVLVPAGIAARVQPDSRTPVGEFHLRLSSQGEIERGVISKIRWSGTVTKAEELYHSWFPAGRPVSGKLVPLSSPPPYMTTIQEFESWLARIEVRREKWMAFVFPEESGTSSSTRTSWLIARSSTTGPLRLVRTFPLIPAERIARVPLTAGLTKKKVVFIGCGNLGSKIAVPLAATGVPRFGLVDPDLYEPDNSIRHEVTIDQFGLPKVLALYQRLLGFNPEVAGQIDGVYIAVGGLNRIEDEQKLLDTVASADLVIDTTGSHGVSRFINELTYDLEIPSLYASVTNGAWGGEIVRVVPPETACWMCWFNQYEFSRPPSEPEPRVGIFAPGCNQPSFTGTSYETGIVANMAAWMAAETLLHGEPGHKDFGGDYLRWEARSKGGSPLPTIKVLPFDRRAGCPVCSGK